MSRTTLAAAILLGLLLAGLPLVHHGCSHGPHPTGDSHATHAH